MNNILVVEDNRDINDMLVRTLRAHGYEVFSALNAFDAMTHFQQQDIACVITDLKLPVKSGEALIAEMRRQSDVHIIVISAKTAIDDKLEGLRVGADDYLFKPFVADEILIKLDNLFAKRSRQASISINQGRIQFDPDINEIVVDHHHVTLTALEHRMIELMLTRLNRVVTRTQFLDVLYEFDADVFDRVVDVHVKNIRAKLRTITETPYIQTVYGLGYKFVGERDD